MDSLKKSIYIVCIHLDIADISSSQISIYPIPTSDVIYIGSSSLHVRVSLSVSITNLLGQSFSPPVIPAHLSGSQHHEAGISLDVRSLPEGIYLLQIRDKNDVLIKTERIVIAR